MSYRTIKTPEISGQVTVGEVELAALNLARRWGAKLGKGIVTRSMSGTSRRKSLFVSKSEQRRVEKKKANRRIKRRTFTKGSE